MTDPGGPGNPSGGAVIGSHPDYADALVINGRSNMSDRAMSTVEVRRYDREDPILVIHGATIETGSRPGKFAISARHLNATDREHDAAYVAHLDGAGIQFLSHHKNRIEFTGAIFSANVYATEPEGTVCGDDGVCDYCPSDPSHPILSFMPPLLPRWKPLNYHLTVVFPKAPRPDDNSTGTDAEGGDGGSDSDA